MPYSRAKEKRLSKQAMWPDLRYNPETGECKLFFSPHDVPPGWTQRPDIPYETPEQLALDKEKMVTELTALGVQVDPRWGKAHLKKVLDDRRSSR